MRVEEQMAALEQYLGRADEGYKCLAYYQLKGLWRAASRRARAVRRGTAAAAEGPRAQAAAGRRSTATSAAARSACERELVEGRVLAEQLQAEQKLARQKLAHPQRLLELLPAAQPGRRDRHARAAHRRCPAAGDDARRPGAGDPGRAAAAVRGAERRRPSCRQHRGHRLRRAAARTAGRGRPRRTRAAEHAQARVRRRLRHAAGVPEPACTAPLPPCSKSSAWTTTWPQIKPRADRLQARGHLSQRRRDGARAGFDRGGRGRGAGAPARRPTCCSTNTGRSSAPWCADGSGRGGGRFRLLRAPNTRCRHRFRSSNQT